MNTNNNNNYGGPTETFRLAVEGEIGSEANNKHLLSQQQPQPQQPQNASNHLLKVEEIDEISTDADLTDEYGSASSDSCCCSIEKLPRNLSITDFGDSKHHHTSLSMESEDGDKNSPLAAILANKNKLKNLNEQQQQQSEKTSMNLCKQVWRNCDAVCFDVDSTVCCDEAIDELAKYVGKSKEVSDITKSAMLGGANFRDALAQRLDIIRPSRKILSQYISSHKPRLTANIEELIERLHQLGVDVYLISGGFDVIIEPAANCLNIPYENVFANSIKFYYDGTYAGFEKNRPTSNQDGKSRVISMLKQTKGYKNIVMIGDGVTDLEACPPADAFIGFGGNQVRETVRDNSDWFVYSFKELITELPYCNNRDLCNP